MAHPPTTRVSLIARLNDAADAAAWNEFVNIYLPLLYRLARSKGLQHADAEELAQEVLAAVARAIHRWEPDADRGRFRDWLFRIARNMIINFLTRPKYRPWGGGSEIMTLLHEQPAATEEEATLFELEHRREVFRYAAARVREVVNEKTWQAFWLTAVEDRPIADVARTLQVSVGNVYLARCRVMTRLKKEVEQFHVCEEHSAERKTPKVFNTKGQGCPP